MGPHSAPTPHAMLLGESPDVGAKSKAMAVVRLNHTMRNLVRVRHATMCAPLHTVPAPFLGIGDLSTCGVGGGRKRGGEAAEQGVPEEKRKTRQDNDGRAKR